jgi:polyhydroxyalkanoate synthesis regulator phasin
MLKGLKGILEKGLQIAAPLIGGSMFGAPGAMFGSGIASLLSGDKPRDALLKAGLSGIAGYRGADGSSMIDKARSAGPVQDTIKRITNQPFTDQNKNMGSKSNFLFDLFKERGSDDNPKPSFGMQAISAGLPAYLSYLAAKEDAKKPGPADPSEYMSAVDTMYGGQFERPPEERRIQNLMPTYKAAGGMMGQQPVNGLKSIEQPVQYSAMTGQGVMGLAKGGSIDVKELETLMEDGKMSYEEAMDYLKSIQGKAKGGQVFPRRTGQIEGPGTKTSDSIPAMLSDGEFVQRTDAVNGAGVMMGAKNAQQAREKGADFMYALQDKLAKMGQRVA